MYYSETLYMLQEIVDKYGNGAKIVFVGDFITSLHL